jgi:hypothetical protein
MPVPGFGGRRIRLRPAMARQAAMTLPRTADVAPRGSCQPGHQWNGQRLLTSSPRISPTPTLRDTDVSRTRTRTIGVMCKGSAKEGDHEVKNADEIGGSGSWGVDCGWNLNGRCKYLIFRQLGGFFTIFHLFFTPYFRWNSFISRHLGKTHGHKRRNNSKWNVENAKRTTNPDAARTGRGAEWELTTKAPRAPRAPRLQRRDEDDDDGGYLNCD